MSASSIRALGAAAHSGELDDAKLVDALRRGDRAAELAAWNRYTAGVGRTVARLYGPGPDADDLIQEVFIRFFRGIGSLRDPGAVRSFLTGICVHVVCAAIGSRRRHSWLRLTRTGELPEVSAPSGEGDVREAVARYYRLLEKLGVQERSIFAARTIEGLTLEQVAALHEISVSTAQRRLRRATAKIAKLVRQDPMLAAFVERGGTR
jgi:RNA polymerase sigma-70 factor, ECF subfamily